MDIIRSTLSKSLERNVEVTFDKLYAEFTAPSHISKVRVGHQVVDKYRRPFKEEVTYMIMMIIMKVMHV